MDTHKVISPRVGNGGREMPPEVMVFLKLVYRSALLAAFLVRHSRYRHNEVMPTLRRGGSERPFYAA